MKTIGKNQVNKVLITYFVAYYAVYSLILSTFLVNLFETSTYLVLHFIVETIIFILIIKFTSNKLKYDFNKWKNTKMSRKVYYIFTSFTLMNAVNIAVNLIIMQFTTVDTTNNQLGIEMMFQRYPIYIVVTAVIFAPIVEELVFRGTIYAHMRQKMGFISCALLNSFIFAGLHFTVSLLMGDLSDIIFIFAYMAQSFVICILYEKTDNIFMPIMLHFLNNAVGILLMSLI